MKQKKIVYQPYLTCKDHLVSGESFQLQLDDNLDLLITSPKPSDANLASYYKSKDYTPHKNKRQNLLQILYAYVQQYMFNKKFNWIEQLKLYPGKVLDIGAGSGDFIIRASSSFKEAYAVEPHVPAQNEISMNSTVKTFSSLGELYEDRSLHGSFDLITLWHALEHMPNLDETIFQLSQLIHEDGKIMIAVPNYKSHDAQHYKSNWAAYDVPRHLWHFSQTAIRRLFFFQRLEIVKTIPLLFDAYYVSWLSELHAKSFPALVKGFYRGFISNLKAKKTGEYSSLVYVFQKKKKWF